jgi:type IV pilus assembly protein PilM
MMKLEQHTYKIDGTDKKNSEVIQKPGSNLAKKMNINSQQQIPANKKRKMVNTNHLQYLIHPKQLFISKEVGFLKKKMSSEIISIEIDSSFIRILHIREIKNKYHIISWAEQPLNDKKMDRSVAIMLAIRNTIDLKVLRRLKVVLSLFGPEIIIRTITVPQLKGNELKEAVFWKNQKEVLNFSEESLWDFQVISEVNEEDKKQLNVLTIITQEHYVSKYLEMLKEIDVYPKKVIVKPIALTLAFNKLINRTAIINKNLLVVDIGRESSILCFYRHMKLEFVRTIAFGSNMIDQTLNQPIILKDKQIMLDPKKITIFKRRHGILIELLQGTDKTYFPFNQLYKFMQPALQMFVNELKRSLAYYQSNYNADEINTIFITGSGCNLKNLDKYLTHQINIPVNLIAPSFPSIVSGTYVPGFEFTACFGATQSNNEKFNFIPKEIRMELKYQKYQKILILLAVLIFIILGYFSNGVLDELSRYKKATEIINVNYQKIHASQVEYDRYKNEINQIEQRLNNINQKLKIDNKICEVLKIISNYIPDDIVLSSINYIERKVTELEVKPGKNGKINKQNQKKGKKEKTGVFIIDGIVYRNFISADITLIDFITKLKKSNYFKDVSLANQRKKIEENVFQFKIECQM